MRTIFFMVLMLFALILSTPAQEPISFFKMTHLEEYINTSEYYLGRPVELSDRYVFLAQFGGLGPSNPQVVGASFSKEGVLQDVKNIKPPGNFDISIGTFKKWGNDSVVACGRAYTSFNDWQGAATYMLDKDLNLLWQLPADSAFYDLSPINDSIAVGYCPYTTPLFSNGPYIGFVNYKTGKIESLKFLKEIFGYPFGLKDTILSLDYCKFTDNSIWMEVRESSGYLRSEIKYSISDSTSAYKIDSNGILFYSAYKDQLLVIDNQSYVNYNWDVVGLKNLEDVAFVYFDSIIPNLNSYIIESICYSVTKIHVFSTYRSNTTRFGVITQLSPTGKLLNRIELTDLATDTTAIYEPRELIPTSDGGYLFIVNKKGLQAVFIMKMDSTFHVRNSDVGVYIGVEEPLMAEKNSNLTLFPNPTTSHFTIQSSSAIKSLTIYNLQGQQLLQKSNLNANIFTVGEQLPSGVYVVKVETEEGVEVRKVLVGSDNGL